MPAVVTIVLLLYAVLLGVFGAAPLIVAIAGGVGVIWQVGASLARGFTSPQPPEEEPVALDRLTEEDLLMDRDRPESA